VSVNHYEPPASSSPAATASPAAAPQPTRPLSSAAAPKKSSGVRRFFSRVGAGITWLRNTVFNTLFVILLLIFIIAIASSSTPPLPDSFALRVAPTGVLVDQRSYLDPASLLLSNTDPDETETLVRDLVEVINKAATDKRVTLIVLEPGRMLGGGISKMNEIGQALENFKQAGKKIIAVSDNYSQDQYYLASFADEIYLHSMGMIEITGYSRYMNYYKTALDKLGVTIHAFRSGKYKDYLEPYLRDDMSEESREHNAQWINELWSSYTDKIESLRRLPPGSINDYVNNVDAHMTLTAGDSAALALEKALVDKTLSRQQMEQTLIDAAGKSSEGNWYNGVNTKTYLANVRKMPSLEPNKIAVIIAAGSIVDGHQPDGNIGSESMLELLRQVRDDKAVKAVVIRIDSGGGSAFASEIIRSEIIALRHKNIPVYISMGSLAASGGYWIATAGDKIWAQPTTITGSIGVFGAFPTLEKSLEKLGVYTDGVGSTELAGTLRLDRPLSEKAAKVVQLGVDNIYQRFIALVAEARNKDINSVDAIAQGHVWTGNKAKELGLVDELGTLSDVIGAIAQTANLSNYSVEFVQRPLSPKEEFFRSLAESQVGSLMPKSFIERTGSLQLLNILGPVLKPLSNLQKMNDPQNIYVQCLDCVTP
jgi:protease-4